MKIRATTRFRNHVILEARERIGLSQARFSDLVGVDFKYFIKLEKMDYRLYKYETVTALKMAAESVAEFIGVPVDEVLIEHLIGRGALQGRQRVVEIPASQLIAPIADEIALLDWPDDSADVVKAVDALALSGGTDALRAQVLRMRYGLEPYGHAMTLRECGEVIGITHQYAKQLEASGLEKMKTLIKEPSCS